MDQAPREVEKLEAFLGNAPNRPKLVNATVLRQANGIKREGAQGVRTSTQYNCLGVYESRSVGWCLRGLSLIGCITHVP